MAIVKATYTKSSAGAKASIRYIEHRPGKDGAKTTRVLFGTDGHMGRWQAYSMVDEAAQGSYFYRFAISPDPHKEDTAKDLHLRDVTEQTMYQLEALLQKQISWVAAVHDDHAPHRHVHVVAIVPERLQVQDFQSLRQRATDVSLAQRHQRDLAQGEQEKKEIQREW